MDAMRPSPRIHREAFDLTCDRCGATMRVSVRRLIGHERLESYDCPECRSLFFCLAWGAPIVQLTGSGTRRAVHSRPRASHEPEAGG